jgi:hypothetical protein
VRVGCSGVLGASRGESIFAVKVGSTTFLK